MSTVTEGYTIVCFVYGWTDNYRCTYLPKGVVKKYRPSKGKHSNPLQNIYKIVWAFIFLIFFFSNVCVVHSGWMASRCVSPAWERRTVLSGSCDATM